MTESTENIIQAGEVREPTLQSIMDAIGAATENTDLRFTSVFSSLENMNLRFTSMFASFLKRMDGMDVRLMTLEHSVGKIEITIENIHDDVAAALSAIDRDSVTIIEHADRISRLEMATIDLS